MKTLSPLLALLLAFASGCELVRTGESTEQPTEGTDPGVRAGGGDEGGGGAIAQHTADLRSVNDSGVKGLARLTLAGNRLVVQVSATGLLENRTHPMYITGGAEEATCPTEAEDANANGLVEHKQEGEFAYGRVALPLEPYPTTKPRSDEIDVELTFPDLDPSKIEPLEDHAIVLAGKRANLHRRGREGRRRVEYVPSLPVACGTISPPQHGGG